MQMSEKRSIINTSVITNAVSLLCQQANYYLPEDVYKGLQAIYSKESSKLSKSLLDEVFLNASLAAEIERPICQDTGLVIVFVEVGQNVAIEGKNLETAINNGVEQAYTEGFLRKSIVDDPVFERKNTKTNTPAIIHTKIVPGSKVKITVAPKGGGSENMSTLRMLKPAEGVEGIINFVVDTIKNAGANPCPPIHVGVGIGGSMEYAAILAKKALLNKVIPEAELEKLAQNDKKAELELKIMQKIQKLGIGVQGLGGTQTAFAVSVEMHPCHIASMPVAVNINCHAARHAEIILDENSQILDKLKPSFDIPFQAESADTSSFKKLDLPLKNEDISELKAGDKVLLTGILYTARDAAHKRLIECIKNNVEMPVDIKEQTIYYVGPCPAKDNEVIGPAGPTTSGRMDIYAPELLNLGLKGMIGKGYRSPAVIEAIKANKAVYFVATGGTASLLAQKIKQAEVVAYPDLGPEAIHKLYVENFPVIVCIDSNGDNYYEIGLKNYKNC